MAALTYVCVISDFTLPTLEACLSLQPAHILLIASDSEHFANQAQRLKAVLQARLADSQVEVLSHASTRQLLDGDDIIANQAWLAAHLVPRLKSATRQGWACAANLTGGTKAMALALAASYAWQRLDYQPLGNKPMQSVSASGQPHYQAQPVAAQQAQDAQPLDIALLHNEKARIGKNNPIRQHPRALQLAQRIWDAQQAQQTALRALFTGFERIWVHQRYQHEQASITLTWAQFLGDTTDTSPHWKAIHQWIEELASLHNPPLLSADEQSITLPGNKAKKQHKLLRDWISGDWLEQLAQYWLEQAGIPTTAIASNVTCAEEDASGSQREADLFVHYRHTTSLIEVKAGLPPDKAPSDLENQLSSLGSRFGKTRKALFLGPQVLNAMHIQRKAQDFWLRCQANQVTLLLKPEQLQAFVQGENPWPKLERGKVPTDFLA